MASGREVDAEEPGGMVPVREIAGLHLVCEQETRLGCEHMNIASSRFGGSESSARERSAEGHRGIRAARRAGAERLPAGCRRHRAGDQGAHCRPLDPASLSLLPARKTVETDQVTS